MPPSYRGQIHHPFKVDTRVRIPAGALFFIKIYKVGSIITNMKKWMIWACVMVILAILIGVFIFYNKGYIQKSIVETVLLCEMENPNFDSVFECQKVINEKYFNRDCSFEFGLVEVSQFGSCRNCTISCK